MNKYDSIQYKNVYSKEYKFHYTKMDSVMKNFQIICERNGLKKKGNLFYTISIVETDGMVHAEFFLPTAQSQRAKDMTYHSYIVIQDMVYMIVDDDFEKNTEWAYASILKAAQEQGESVISPFYNEIFTADNRPFMVVKAVLGKQDERMDSYVGG